MKKREKTSSERRLFFIVLRYFLLLLLILLFYYYTPIYHFLLNLTVYSSKLVLGLFYPIRVEGNILLINSIAIEIISACVGMSAYLLLLILNFSNKLTIVRRIYSLLFSLLGLFVINLLRIVIFTLLLVKNFAYFDSLHKFSWYFLSTLIVVGIWFLTAYIFKIKSFPFYTDLMEIINIIKKKK